MNKQTFLDAAEVFDAWRVIPRALTVLFGFMVWHVTTWYMAIHDPSAAQTTFTSLIWGAAPTWFGIYTTTGRKWGRNA